MDYNERNLKNIWICDVIVAEAFDCRAPMFGGSCKIVRSVSSVAVCKNKKNRENISQMLSLLLQAFEGDRELAFI